MKLLEILAHCEIAFDQLVLMRGQLERECQDDTAFALGEAIGAVHKAKALVERDLRAQEEADA
jgi:hypothetical protein